MSITGHFLIQVSYFQQRMSIRPKGQHDMSISKVQPEVPEGLENLHEGGLNTSKLPEAVSSTRKAQTQIFQNLSETKSILPLKKHSFSFPRTFLNLLRTVENGNQGYEPTRKSNAKGLRHTSAVTGTGLQERWTDSLNPLSLSYLVYKVQMIMLCSFQLKEWMRLYHSILTREHRIFLLLCHCVPCHKSV